MPCLSFLCILHRPQSPVMVYPILPWLLATLALNQNLTCLEDFMHTSSRTVFHSILFLTSSFQLLPLHILRYNISVKMPCDSCIFQPPLVVGDNPVVIPLNIHIICLSPTRPILEVQGTFSPHYFCISSV